jgi:hypothetical protein
VQAQSGYIARHCLKKKKGWDGILVLECLPSVHKTLGSIPAMKKVDKICNGQLRELPGTELWAHQTKIQCRLCLCQMNLKEQLQFKLAWRACPVALHWLLLFTFLCWAYIFISLLSGKCWTLLFQDRFYAIPAGNWLDYSVFFTWLHLLSLLDFLEKLQK